MNGAPELRNGPGGGHLRRDQSQAPRSLRHHRFEFREEYRADVECAVLEESEDTVAYRLRLRESDLL